MIRGPNYVFLEIPGTGYLPVSRFLVTHCKGQILTPEHSSLTEKIDPKKTKVFCVVRKPFARVKSLFEEYGHEAENLLVWWEWFKKRDNPLNLPYAHWTKHCNTILKIEEISDKMPILMETLGYGKIAPEVECKLPELSDKEYEYIKSEFKADFLAGNYKMDRRTYV
jgi:hypothetical protein